MTDGIGVHYRPFSIRNGWATEEEVKLDIKPLSKYQAIWAQAKRNGTIQDRDSLPAQNWTWPTDTFLQRRLTELRNRKIEQD
ncbi:MAG TPA: hypothetical protein VKB46_14570 [Pyrinomonadaceae bacterium]|nr:hypothetical protein [Pyrinomonadaceae bacterium]